MSTEVLFFTFDFSPGGGGTHILRQTGMSHSIGSLFYKKSLNMCPVFHKKKKNP